MFFARFIACYNSVFKKKNNKTREKNTPKFSIDIIPYNSGECYNISNLSMTFWLTNTGFCLKLPFCANK